MESYSLPIALRQIVYDCRTHFNAWKFGTLITWWWWRHAQICDEKKFVGNWKCFFWVDRLRHQIKLNILILTKYLSVWPDFSSAESNSQISKQMEERKENRWILPHTNRLSLRMGEEDGKIQFYWNEIIKWGKRWAKATKPTTTTTSTIKCYNSVMCARGRVRVYMWMIMLDALKDGDWSRIVWHGIE